MTGLRPALGAVRRLGPADLPALRELLDAEPLAAAVLTARVEAAGSLAPSRLGGELLGLTGRDGLRAACYVGGHVLPVGGDRDDWDRLGDELAGWSRTCSSIIGPAQTLAVLWPALSYRWGPARALRPAQPLLVATRLSAFATDPLVRRARPSDLERYQPAATAMFVEELGLSPFDGRGRAAAYRQRLANLIAEERVFLRLDEDGNVVFKAEIGACTAATCQLQGVWVRPDLRGRGIGTRAMAAVLEQSLQLAPSVSLYVNDYNLPGRRLYDRLGMTEVGSLATVLF